MSNPSDLLEAHDHLDKARAHLVAMAAYLGDSDIGGSEADVVFRSLAKLDCRLAAATIATPTPR